MEARFSDFTFAVEQYEAASAEAAVEAFVERAESLAAYDKAEWRRDPAAALGMIHIGGGMRGAWIWTSRVDLIHDEVALYGGIVVQTDRAGPVRRDAA